MQQRPGLATTMNVDGFGDRANKVAKYREFTHDGTHFHRGFKLFYEEDTGLMTPAQRRSRCSRRRTSSSMSEPAGAPRRLTAPPPELMRDQPQTKRALPALKDVRAAGNLPEFVTIRSNSS